MTENNTTANHFFTTLASFSLRQVKLTDYSRNHVTKINILIIDFLVPSLGPNFDPNWPSLNLRYHQDTHCDQVSWRWHEKMLRSRSLIQMMDNEWSQFTLCTKCKGEQLKRVTCNLPLSWLILQLSVSFSLLGMQLSWI